MITPQNKYQAVKLDELLCGTKGLCPTYTFNNTKSDAAPAERKPKIESTEVISGVNWYYYLVPNAEHKCLMDCVGRDEINERFVVCATLPKKNKKKCTLLFAAFDSVLTFINYIKHIERDRWHFFEVILGGQPQKLYFDIDIKAEDVKSNIDEFTQSLLNCLVGRITSTYLARGYQIDIARQILMFSSNSLLKRSYHVIVDGYCVMNNRENLVLASEVLEGFPSEFKPFIDSSMYSSKQQLRLYGSQKPGSGRPKIFVDQWHYGTSLIQYPYPEVQGLDEICRENLRHTTIFQASCVTATSTCKIIYILFDSSSGENRNGRPKLWAETSAFDDEMTVTDDILKAICERIDQRIFEVYYVDKVVGSLVLLRRRDGKGPKGKVQAHCSLCDRPHDSENAFLRLSKVGKVYFYCRRNEGNNKYVCNVSELMPVVEDEISELHVQSAINQLRGTTPVPLHSELRTLAQANLVFKRR